MTSFISFSVSQKYFLFSFLAPLKNYFLNKNFFNFSHRVEDLIHFTTLLCYALRTTISIRPDEHTTDSKALFFWSKTLSNYCLLFSAIYFVWWLIFMAKSRMRSRKNVFQFFSLADADCSPRIMQFIFRLFLICFFTYYYCHALDIIISSWANFYCTFFGTILMYVDAM